MISYEQKQQMIRNANDAQAHARSILAKCVAGLAVVALLVIAGTWTPRDEVSGPAIAAKGNAEGGAAASRRETFEARRAFYEVERRAGEPRQAATR
jgi:hypothetical protein